MPARHPHQIFHNIVEERYRLFTLRLAELTESSGTPETGGDDPDTRQALLRWARQGVADAALALQRMSEGTYGVCEDCGHAIPAGHLRAQPEALYCVPCEQRRPVPTSTPGIATAALSGPATAWRPPAGKPSVRLRQVA
jgi:DnaK suppressor protein